MASSMNKVDMSLDQIIKLQRKESKQSTAGTSGLRGRGNRMRGRGRGRGAGRLNNSFNNQTNAAGTSPMNRKLGVRANLTARRMSKGRLGVAGRRGRGAGSVFQQRIAQNIVKRALLQNRRLAAEQRRGLSTGQRGANSTNTRRLVADVRHWRNTARQLQQALQVQQGQSRFRLRRRFGNTGGAGRQVISSPVSNVKQRLGWRQNTGDVVQSPRGRGGFGRGRRGGQNTPNVKGRGTVGQMQSDLLQNRQVSVLQQRRQQVAASSRARRQQRIGQGRNLGFSNTTSFNQKPTFQGRGRRGRGGLMANRFFMRTTDLGNSFSQGGTGRQSLHERFGGGRNAIVSINTSAGGARGRNRRQIFF